MVRGIMYNSLEWSKCPLTFTGLYSKFFSSIGSAGRGMGSAMTRDSNSAISFSFHFRRWTCQVPRPKAVAGMKSRNHWRKESSSALAAAVSAVELQHLCGLQTIPERTENPKTLLLTAQNGAGPAQAHCGHRVIRLRRTVKAITAAIFEHFRGGETCFLPGSRSASRGGCGVRWRLRSWTNHLLMCLHFCASTPA